MTLLELKVVAERLYRTLVLMPCACSRKWDKGKSVLVSTCRRCAAMAEYESVAKRTETTAASVEDAQQ